MLRANRDFVGFLEDEDNVIHFDEGEETLILYYPTYDMLLEQYQGDYSKYDNLSVIDSDTPYKSNHDLKELCIFREGKYNDVTFNGVRKIIFLTDKEERAIFNNCSFPDLVTIFSSPSRITDVIDLFNVSAPLLRNIKPPSKGYQHFRFGGKCDITSLENVCGNVKVVLEKDYSGMLYLSDFRKFHFKNPDSFKYIPNSKKIHYSIGLFRNSFMEHYSDSLLETVKIKDPSRMNEHLTVSARKLTILVSEKHEKIKFSSSDVKILNVQEVHLSDVRFKFSDGFLHGLSELEEFKTFFLDAFKIICPLVSDNLRKLKIDFSIYEYIVENRISFPRLTTLIISGKSKSTTGLNGGLFPKVENLELHNAIMTKNIFVDFMDVKNLLSASFSYRSVESKHSIYLPKLEKLRVDTMNGLDFMESIDGIKELTVEKFYDSNMREDLFSKLKSLESLKIRYFRYSNNRVSNRIRNKLMDVINSIDTLETLTIPFIPESLNPNIKTLRVIISRKETNLTLEQELMENLNSFSVKKFESGKYVTIKRKNIKNARTMSYKGDMIHR